MGSKQMRQDIEAVLNYLWHEEKKDYCCNRSRKHIYLVLKRLAKEIKYRAMSVRYTVRYDEKNGYMLGFSLQ